MKISKKIVSLAAAIAMSASLFAAPVSASAADVEKIGLSVNNADDRQVFVKDGAVWAFSHPWHGSYQIKNSVLVGSRLISSEGYTLKVTDKDGKELPDINVVGDSYLQATKDNETIYIPIVDQVEDAAATGINQDVLGANSSDASHLDRSKTSAFGRGFDEVAAVYSMPAPVAGAWAEGSRLEYAFGNDLTEANAPITAEISVYVDGDAKAQIRTYGYKLLMIAADGSVQYNVSGTFKTLTDKLETGKWHRIAISVDKAKQDWNSLWIDGIRLEGNIGNSWRQLPTELYFGAASDCGEGNIAFADPRVYYGYYNSAYDLVNVTGESADVTIKEGKIIYNDAAVDTADKLKAEIMKITDARDAKVYENADKAAFGLGAESVVAIVPRSGGIPAEYTVEGTATPFQKIGLEISDKYTRGFHHLNSTASVDNYYVKKLTEQVGDTYVDKLAVFNNANQIEYTSFGWKVLDALSSTKGYVLSIWDSEKQIERSVPNEQVIEDGKTVVRGARTQEVVTDGDWLKAEKGDEVIWIPIIDKIEKMQADDISTLGWNNGNLPGNNVGSLAGKSADDVAYAFVTNNSAKEGRYQLQGGELANYFGGSVYTYAMNVYADGNATAQLVPVAGSWITAFEWKGDGSYSVGAKPADGTLERGKWHRVAVTLDIGRGQLQVFVDGENKTISAGAATKLDRIDLKVAAGSTGTVAYDDLRVYEGYYEAGEDLVDFKAGDVAIADGTIAMKEGTTIEDARQTIESEIVGASLSEYEGGYLLVTPSKSYHYLTTKEYPVNDFGFANDNIVLTEKNGRITATTVFSMDLADARLYLAEYDAGGQLVGITSDDVGEEGIPSVSVAVTEGNSYKAFLWLTNEEYTILPISLAK